ncbi:3-hydroxyacyl-CoA dehydrogenase NAD-binding domain-containing protein [Paracoccus tegillarcae]|nr:3-hydroxyacyl-CoA dehydrogenase NAD-binding domain-containing protein [Paracoccus tegillarcae]
MEIETVGGIGAGQMGNGIAQAGFDVLLNDVSQDHLDDAEARITKNLDCLFAKGKLDGDEKERTLSRIQTTLELSALGPMDLVIEAASECESIKNTIFADRRCCKTRATKDSLRESMRLDGVDE